jgi:hypothetical protein
VENALSPSTPAEAYGKLERVNIAGTPSSSRVRTNIIKPSCPGYEDIDLDQESYGRLERNSSHSPPPLPMPRENRAASKSPILGKRLVPPKKPSPYPGTRQSPSPMPQDEAQEEYGQLDHTHHNPNDTHNIDTYETLDDAMVVHPEEQARLSHGQFTSPMEDEDYGRLDTKRSWEPNKKVSVSSLRDGESELRVVKGSRIVRSLPQLGVQGQEYGKLDHKSNKQGPKVSSRSKQGRVKPMPVPRQSSLQTPDEGYGHLERNEAASRFGFDPYGSLPSDASRMSVTSNSSLESQASSRSGTGDMIQEESSTPLYSTIMKGDATPNTVAPEGPIYSSLKKPTTRQKPEIQPTRAVSDNGVPPPGYENATPLSITAAAQAALATNGVPPTVPPRASDRKKQRYQNVGPDGKVLLDSQPMPDDGLIDNAIYSEGAPKGQAVDNDYIEDNSLHMEPEAASISPTEAVSDMGAPQMTSPKPPTAPKPKAKPRPKQST